MVDPSLTETTLPPGGAEPAASPVTIVRREALSPEALRAEVEALIERGHQEQDPLRQLRCFERAHMLDMNDPVAMSLHGMMLATVLHRYQEGIVFCEEAVRRQGPSPSLLVNLAKAFLAARNKREAVRCLRRALARSDGEDDRARVELASLGLRRRPVIPFLPRSFFLNKLLGRWRHALLERRAPPDDGRHPIPAELGQLSGDLQAARATLQETSDQT